MGIVQTFSISSCYCDDESSFYSDFAIFTACIVNILGPWLAKQNSEFLPLENDADILKSYYIVTLYRKYTRARIWNTKRESLAPGHYLDPTALAAAGIFPVHTQTHGDTHRHAHTYIHTHMYCCSRNIPCTHADTHIHTHTRRDTHRHTHTHTCVCVRAYACTCVCIRMYVCMWA